MPSGLPNFQVSDIFFLDSLTGWAVTGNSNPNDTSGYILKTTNGGDNWILKFTDIRDFSRVKFINSNTGFVSGGYFDGAKVYKSTDGGNSWSTLFSPSLIDFADMSVLNNDTIWLVDPINVEGGVFRTTNGGASWDRQAVFGSNPSHIYMYNARIGFIDAGGLRRTTDGGASWTLPITGAGNFLDMYFADSLTGWKCNQDMKKTTNGGLTWIGQTLPSGGNIVLNYMLEFSNINSDTIWGSGGVIVTSAGGRGMVFRTVNTGQSWLFQVPDTNINIFQYKFVDFVNKLKGWAYNPVTGVHTTNGGDPIFYTSIKQISTNISNEFKLGQNSPNPFNPITNIKYQIKSNVKREKSNVKLVVYNVLGREITVLVEGELSTGVYETDFDGTKYSSGIYFYSLIIDGKLVDTKKMVLIK